MKTTNDRLQVLNGALDKMHFEGKWNARIQNTYRIWDKDKKISFAVNWYACGEVSTAFSREFARQLLICSNVADRLNSLELEITSEPDTLITDRETYEKFVEVLEDAIKNEKYDQFERFFSLGNDYDPADSEWDNGYKAFEDMCADAPYAPVVG